MPKLFIPELPKLNKGKLLIVSDETWKTLVTELEDIFKQSDTEFVKIQNILNSQDTQIKQLQAEVKTLKSQVSILASAIKQGGFINE